jgi:hypothetical protein
MTTIHFFDDFRSLQKRSDLILPKVMDTDQNTFEELRPLDGREIKLDVEIIYFNFWVSTDRGLIIPDFARLPGTKKGFYLKQTEVMHALRDGTKQCSFCNAQYWLAKETYCPYCIGNNDVPEDQLYRTFLRPVSTFDIHLTDKSIKVPAMIIEKHNRIPELTNQGIMINI